MRVLAARLRVRVPRRGKRNCCKPGVLVFVPVFRGGAPDQVLRFATLRY
jgi:hypothetical protein